MRSVGTQVSVVNHSIGTYTDETHLSSIGTNTEIIHDLSNRNPPVGLIAVTSATLQQSKPNLSSDEASDNEDSDIEYCFYFYFP